MASGKSLNADSLNLNRKYSSAPDVIAAARRAVCDRATDATEAAELMRMLGIHPDQDDER